MSSKRQHHGTGDFEWALHVSRDATSLDAYLEHCPREASLPLVHEELRHDPVAVVERAVAGLGLEPHPLDDAALERVHSTRTDIAAGLTVTRTVGHGSILRTLQRRTPEPRVRAIRFVVGRWNLHEVTLTQGQRDRGTAALAPEIERLRSEWGVDTSWWNTASGNSRAVPRP